MPIDPLGSSSASGIPAPPPSSIAESAGTEYSAVREQAAETTPGTEAAATITSATVTDGGFDVPSAAIGAAAMGLLALLAAGALTRRPATRRHRPASA